MDIINIKKINKTLKFSSFTKCSFKWILTFHLFAWIDNKIFFMFLSNDQWVNKQMDMWDWIKLSFLTKYKKFQ